LSDQVVDGLDEAITMMNEGEVYLVTVPPQHAFGSEGSQQQLAFVPPNVPFTILSAYSRACVVLYLIAYFRMIKRKL
jgi:hypothetical protein